MHPYQGAMYHGFARSAGLSFWESLGYTVGGSVLWEIAGETTAPSMNDQIATSIGGSFFGESLFRMASLVLEKGERMPPFWRGLTAAAVSPATGFNRVAYGDRFEAVFPSRKPSLSARVRFGATSASSIGHGFTESFSRPEAVADVAVDYGLPGPSNYAYRRPFDYFSFQFTATSANYVDTVFTRGVLVGSDYGSGAAGHRGLWGLFGVYDYVAPEIFRVSTTAVALGTTFERRLFGSSAWQSTLLGGVGYGAAGTIQGSSPRGYHYGMTPHLLLANRFIVSDRMSVDLSLRDYHVSGMASTEADGSENIARADVLVTLRLHDRQALSAGYIWSRRASTYPEAGRFVQSHGSFGLFYTYVTDRRFGATIR
jgi:hypothetical protein